MLTEEQMIEFSTNLDSLPKYFKQFTDLYVFISPTSNITYHGYIIDENILDDDELNECTPFIEPIDNYCIISHVFDMDGNHKKFYDIHLLRMYALFDKDIIDISEIKRRIIAIPNNNLHLNKELVECLRKIDFVDLKKVKSFYCKQDKRKYYYGNEYKVYVIIKTIVNLSLYTLNTHRCLFDTLFSESCILINENYELKKDIDLYKELYMKLSKELIELKKNEYSN